MRKIGLIRCPHCGSSSVFLSHRKTLWEKISFLFLLRLVRCHDCFFHHYRPIFVPIKRGRIDERTWTTRGSVG